MDSEAMYDWVMGLGEPYGVDPVIFGAIYVGAIPIFWVAIAWLAYNIKNGKSVAGPVLLACACAVSAYIYLIIVGENVPLWVYGFILAIIAYAIYSTLNKVKQKKAEVKKEQMADGESNDQ